MSEDRKPLAVRGLSGDYPATELPGSLIEPKPGQQGLIAAAQAAKLKQQQENLEDGNG